MREDTNLVRKFLAGISNKDKNLFVDFVQS